MSAPTSKAAAWLVAALTVAVLTVTACNTPSVPIPPPAEEKIVFDFDETNGSARFSYDAEEIFAGAVVYVFNRTEGRGVISVANADGSVDPTDPFPAQLNDEIVVSFETDDELVSTCVRFGPGRSDAGRRCDF